MRFLTDASLVKAALRRRPEALAEIVRRYQRRAHAIAVASGIRPGCTDDVVQEAFYQCLRDIDRLREPRAFGAWFLTIVRNVARKSFRQDERGAPLRPGREMETSVTDEIGRRELNERIWQQVQALPGEVREAICLYYYEGESVRAVAKALGVPRDTVKNRLRRGRENLRETLWRELKDSLQDVLPPTRDWHRRARRLTLVISAALPASWAGTAEAAGIGATPLKLSLQRILADGVLLIIGNKLLSAAVGSLLLLVLGFAVLLHGPSSIWPRIGSQGARVPAVPVATASDRETATAREIHDADPEADSERATPANVKLVSIERLIEELRRAVRAGNATDIARIRRAISGLGEEAVPRLWQLVSGDPELAGEALRIVREIGDPAAWEKLLAALGSVKDGAHAYLVLDTLLDLAWLESPDELAVALLSSPLTSIDRVSLLEKLAASWAGNAIPILLGVALQTREYTEIWPFLHLVKESGHPGHMEDLVSVFDRMRGKNDHQASMIADGVATALAKILPPREAAQTILALVSQKENRVFYGMWAGIRTAAEKDPTIYSSLAERLSLDLDERTRYVIVSVLGQGMQTWAAPILREHFAVETDAQVRAQLISSLAYIKNDPTFLDFVEENLHRAPNEAQRRNQINVFVGSMEYVSGAWELGERDAQRVLEILVSGLQSGLLKDGTITRAAATLRNLGLPMDEVTRDLLLESGVDPEVMTSLQQAYQGILQRER